jgi:hypothetical protein
MVLRVGPLDRLITDKLHYTVAGSWAKIAEAFSEAFGAGGRNHLSNPERGRLIRLE